MKVINAIVKSLVALAAVAGTVYLIATYGEEIVAWAKKLWQSISTCPCRGGAPEPEAEAPEAEAVEEAAPAEQAAPAEEAPAEEPAPEAPAVEENAVVADESDFEG